MSTKPLLVVRMNVVPEKEEEFNAWYNQVHLPDLMRAPGVVGARRYVAIRGRPKYMALYEFADETGMAAYQASEEGKRARQDFLRRWPPFTSDLSRHLYRPLATLLPAGTATDAGLTDRPVQIATLNIAPERKEEIIRWYDTHHIAQILTFPGALSARRYEAIEGEPRYMTLYEYQSEDALEAFSASDLVRQLVEERRQLYGDLMTDIRHAYYRQIYCLK